MTTLNIMNLSSSALQKIIDYSDTYTIYFVICVQTVVKNKNELSFRSVKIDVFDEILNTMILWPSIEKLT